MPEEFFWSLVVTGTLIAWGILIVCAQVARNRSRLRLQELLHHERVLALEKDLSLPEIADFDEASGGGRSRVSLAAVGWVLCTLGLGILAAFALAPLDTLNAVWTLGFIPLAVGIGLLLHDRRARAA